MGANPHPHGATFGLHLVVHIAARGVQGEGHGVRFLWGIALLEVLHAVGA